MARDPRGDATVNWPFRVEVDPVASASAGEVCPECAGRGRVLDSISDEKFPVSVPCNRCQVWCAECRKHVKRAAHHCARKETNVTT